jgi:hypothetical protein
MINDKEINVFSSSYKKEEYILDYHFNSKEFSKNLNHPTNNTEFDEKLLNSIFEINFENVEILMEQLLIQFFLLKTPRISYFHLLLQKQLSKSPLPPSTPSDFKPSLNLIRYHLFLRHYSHCHHLLSLLLPQTPQNEEEFPLLQCWQGWILLLWAGQ